MDCLFIKIRPVVVELSHEDTQIDGEMDGHDAANSQFSQFCKRV